MSNTDLIMLLRMVVKVLTSKKVITSKGSAIYYICALYQALYQVLLFIFFNPHYGSHVRDLGCAFAGAWRGGVTLAQSESKKLFADESSELPVKNYRLLQLVGASEVFFP